MENINIDENLENLEGKLFDESLQSDSENKDSLETSQGDNLEQNVQISYLKDKYLRLFAEFDNYKKRTTRERLELIRTAAKDTLSSLLPILDDFDRAKKIADLEGSTEPFSEGVNLVYNKLYSTLKSKELLPLESDGKAFDPEFHEAITEIPVAVEDLKGKVIETIEKGYFLHGKLIRFAKVVVGK